VAGPVRQHVLPRRQLLRFRRPVLRWDVQARLSLLRNPGRADRARHCEVRRERHDPVTAVDKIVAPVFVYQGVRDPVTPQHEADQIVAALRARRIPVEYMLIANEGHGVTRRENIIAYLARSYRFLAEHLQLPPRG
jgi:pimeloyl-ACP methyl ester carboxylesterase